ncbi:hypothetical protein KSC_107580 [Ktedonobacter sp. SOSP1-52]|uniref:hypothetical protein n=1 Tax=Ktedonobacter sp. SOSP1-52 TaxID=2778366 RepID=UPI0019152E23|nr:hypothetical protein [Ktedonobacter sp. SOSP1-52]GHO71866.1 hypothetical protein KSC_107580 [Ktedonobacter sp. SOSP1-52]
MTLYEPLNICLLATEHRYPQHIMEFNEDVLSPIECETKGWNAVEMLNFLEDSWPALLEAMALLVVDGQQSTIYIPTYSKCKPAFQVHLRGHIPAQLYHTEIQHHALVAAH